MTMPQTAAMLREFDASSVNDLTDEQLGKVIACLEQDLPGVVGFVDQAAVACAAENGRFTLTVRTIDQMGRQAWDGLVSRTSRLFASPFAGLVKEWSLRRHGVAVEFVNCCALAAQRHSVDRQHWLSAQIANQLTPDC